MPRTAWLSCAQFAGLAGISVRAAQKAFDGVSHGGTWRGYRLDVAEVDGQGGRSGRRYEVRLASLPPELQARYAELYGPFDEPSQEPLETPISSRLEPHEDDPDSEFDFGDTEIDRWNAVQNIIEQTAPGTRERRLLVQASAAARLVSAATVYRWLRGYESHGHLGIARKRRPDAGRKRYVISAAWDRVADSFGIPQDKRKEIAQDVLRRIRSEWRSGSPSSGWREVQAKVMPFLMEESRAVGMNLANDKLRGICRVPKRTIRNARKYRAVALIKKDAGRASATLDIRIMRDWSRLRPCEMVCCDVHPVDTAVFRIDGSTAYGRLVSWYDVRTGRLFVTPVLLQKGEGLTARHVLESFAVLCADPDWGVPPALYTDRGSEYKAWQKLFEPLAKIRAKLFTGGANLRPGTHMAKAYQPQAKAIEHVFAQLERFMAHMPGHTGSNRMNSKVSRKGKPVEPVSWENFCKQLKTAVEAYNNLEKVNSHHLKGKSPNDAFREFVNAGWRSFTKSREELRFVFAKPETRVVQPGGTFSLAGEIYYADELAVYADCRARIEVRIPMFGDERGVFCFDEAGEFIGLAEPETPYRHDEAGIAESRRRRLTLGERVRTMSSETDDLDQRDSWEAFNRAHDAPAAARPSNVVSIDANERRAARALKRAKTPAAPADDIPLSKEEIDALLDRIIARDSNVSGRTPQPKASDEDDVQLSHEEWTRLMDKVCQSGGS